MLTADPRIIRDVRVVPHLSFAEASELAYFGAKVLHPATIQPAVARNIPVRILNSKRPEDPVGTLITAERPAGSGPLTAVASKKNVTCRGHRLHENAHGARISAAHLRGLRTVQDRRRRCHDV
jgi:aspartate kinase